MSSASLFRHDEYRLKILEYETERVKARERERYQGEAERIGGGNPLFFPFLPHREMRELIPGSLHLFFSLFVSVGISDSLPSDILPVPS